MSIMSMPQWPPSRSDNTVVPSSMMVSSSQLQHQPQEEEDDEEPGLSSAALCISFHLLGKHHFHPEFTHQCFEGEWIRGYQPSPEILEKHRMLDQQKGSSSSSSPTSPSSELLLHSSHGHHEEKSTHHLSVSIVLAPSCRMCSVSVNTEKKKKQRPIRTRRQASTSASLLPDAKRPKLETLSDGDADGGNDVEEENSASDTSDQFVWNDNEDDDSDFEVDDSSSDTPPQDDDSGRTRQRRMRTDEILERVSKALPMLQVNSNENKDKHTVAVEDDYLKQPIGTVLQEYQRKIVLTEQEADDDDTIGDFVLCLADGKDQGVADYHNQVQRMALWFIETADDVDLTSDQGGGYWNVLYLFRRHNITDTGDDSSDMSSNHNNKYKYSLVGYMTLFHFLAPFKKPKSGIVMRICQVLVLPPYQRAGHGKMLMGAVHDIANGKYASLLTTKTDESYQGDVVEINVEDPAPAFCALRNRFDYELLVRAIDEGNNAWMMSEQYVGGEQDLSIRNESFFHVLPESEAIAAGAIAKITPQQVQIAYELYKLNALERALDDNDDERELLEKRFRLMVKKRLLKVHREDLGAYPTKQEKQDFLAKVFDETLVHYRSILG